MKATDLIKTSLKAKDIYEAISEINKSKPIDYKHFIPHYIYVSNEEQAELLRMGFKISYGEWNRGEYGLIIEW